MVGAGGHAAELSDYVDTLIRGGQSVELLGFLDDDPKSYERYAYQQPFLGSIADYRVDPDVQYLCGIANLTFRKSIVLRFLEAGATFKTLVHPTAMVSRTASIERGVVLAPNVNVGPNVEIGAYTMVNARASLGHDTRVGSFNFISPNVCLSGFTHVGDDNLFGINSATLPKVQIGNRNKIAAGMVLDGNVGDDTVVFFRHKEKVIAIPKS